MTSLHCLFDKWSFILKCITCLIGKNVGWNCDGAKLSLHCLSPLSYIPPLLSPLSISLSQSLSLSLFLSLSSLYISLSLSISLSLLSLSPSLLSISLYISLSLSLSLFYLSTLFLSLSLSLSLVTNDTSSRVRPDLVTHV